MSPIDATERSNDRSLAASCAVLGAAVGVFGIAFGVGSVAAGGSVAMTCVMSLLVFTGSVTVLSGQRDRIRRINCRCARRGFAACGSKWRLGLQCRGPCGVRS